MGEEKFDFALGAFFRIRAVDGVFVNGKGKGFANRSFFGNGGVSGTHDFAIKGDGVVRFENLDDDRGGSHLFDHAGKERLVLVFGVKFLGLFRCKQNPFLGDNMQPGFFNHGVDLAGNVARGCVRFDYREGSFHRFFL